MEEQCGGCRFWDGAYGPHKDEGICRRYPPVLDPSYMLMAVMENERKKLDYAEEGIQNWAQPRTCDDFWCGEFQPIKPAP